MATFPKILILSSYNLSGNCATDITLRSIFNQWPKNKILIITTLHTSKPYAETIIIDNSALGSLRRIALSVLFGDQRVKDNKNTIPGAILSSGENKTTVKSKFYTIGAAYIDMFVPKIMKKELEKIKQFEPDVIYSPLGNRRLIRLSRQISKQLNVPIVPHFMDDWPAIRYTGSIWLKLPRLLLLHSLERMFKSVEFGCCISEKMCNEYLTRYKKEFITLMNSVTAPEIKNHKVNSHNVNSKITLVYLGGLHLNRWQTLIKLDDAIGALNRDINSDVRLVIYTSDEDKSRYASLFSANASFKDYVDHSDVPKVMAQSDYLVHIESFDINVLKFIEYSISTKIPEYLASSRPIIAIGPGNAASIEYLELNNCAYVIKENSTKEILKTLLKAISGSFNEVFLDNSYDLVLRNHSSHQLNQLIYLLSQISNKRKLESKKI